MSFVKNKIRGAIRASRTAINNEKGLTLIEMLVAILIFILASVLIVTLVTSALDKPKQAGVKSAMNAYESAAQLVLLETSGAIPKGIVPADELKTMIAEYNLELDPSAVFSDTGASTIKNAYGKVYNVAIATVPASNKASIVITTEGAKAGDDYITAVYYLDGEIIIGTKGFGRNDKKIASADLTTLTGGAVLGAPVQ